MPAQQEQWIATAYLESGTIAKGAVGCLNAAGTKYVVASSANRTATGRRSACIALTAGDADNPSGAGFEAQYVGVVPPSISGLGAGTASPIRVSSAGVLERASFNPADDMVGRCDTDGTAYVCFPLIGLSASFGSAGAAAPTNSVQVSNSDGTFRGLTHASGSADGHTEHAADRAGGAATEGDDRFSKTGSTYVRNGQNTDNICVWRHEYSASPSPRNTIVMGIKADFDLTKEVDDVAIYPHLSLGIAAGKLPSGSSDIAAELFVAAPGTWPALGSERMVFLQPTLLIGRTDTINNLLIAGTDPTGGQLGGIVMSVLDTAGTPATGFVSVYPNSSTGHLMQKLHDGTVFDLAAPGAGLAGQLQVSNGAGVLTAPGTYVGADYISLIAGTPDGAGVRLANNTALAFQNFGGTADIAACYVDSANQVRVGSAFDATQTGILFATPSGHTFTWNFGSTTYAVLSETEFAIDAPRHGNTSPYASEGQATFAVTLASHTLTPTEYTRRILKFTGVLGGTSTITLPAPANADASYVKGIRNTSTSALTLTKGSGTTASVAAGTDKQVLITPDGVFVA